MTNPTHDPQPIARPTYEELYITLLCQVHAMRLVQYTCYTRPTTVGLEERSFREALVDTWVQEELKTLNVTVNQATLFIPEAEIPY